MLTQRINSFFKLHNEDYIQSSIQICRARLFEKIKDGAYTCSACFYKHFRKKNTCLCYAIMQNDKKNTCPLHDFRVNDKKNTCSPHEIRANEERNTCPLHKIRANDEKYTCIEAHFVDYHAVHMYGYGWVYQCTIRISRSGCNTTEICNRVSTKACKDIESLLHHINFT